MTTPARDRVVAYRPEGWGERSAVVRWGFVAVAIVAGALVGFGPADWRDTPSLRLVDQLGIPWLIFTVILWIYAGLLASHRATVQIVGYWLGFLVFGLFILSIAVTVRPDRPLNVVVLALALDGLLAHYAAARRAQMAAVVDGPN